MAKDPRLSTHAVIMGGGEGSRLYILTKHRSKPAVATNGNLRIIDFVLTNIGETPDISDLLILTQYEKTSLDNHIGHGSIWGFGDERRLTVCSPSQEGRRVRDKSYHIKEYEGTADAVRKSMPRINSKELPLVLILGGDHAYRTDYNELLQQHVDSSADLTIMANVVPEENISSLGIMKIDKDKSIVDFYEKPESPELVKDFSLDLETVISLKLDPSKKYYLASMGNYVFDREKLNEFLKDDEREDFGKHIIPGLKESGKRLIAYIYPEYWADIGKISDYFEFNMAYAAGNGPINLGEKVVRTYLRNLPMATITDSDVKFAQLSPGDRIESSQLRLVIAGYQVIVDSGSEIDHSLLLGADRNTSSNRYSSIVRSSKLSKVVLDKNVWVEGCDLGPHNGDPEEREAKLIKSGLEPYSVNDEGMITGDFYIDKETGILCIRKQREIDSDKKRPFLYNITA